MKLLSVESENADREFESSSTTVSTLLTGNLGRRVRSYMAQYLLSMWLFAPVAVSTLLVAIFMGCKMYWEIV